MASIAHLARRASSIPYVAAKSFSSAAASHAPSHNTPLFHPKPQLRRLDPRDRNVQWIFLGCPGVGKGTYASRLCNLLGVPHIATGDLVREELASSGPLSAQVSFHFVICCYVLFHTISIVCALHIETGG